MRFIFAAFLSLWASAGLAQDTALPEALDQLGDHLAEEMQGRAQNDPESFVREVSELILGHGQNGQIDAQEIENFIALERAYWRARELRRFLLADLNGDGDITAEEMSILAATQSARQRAKSVLNFRAADRNGDGVLSGAEQRTNADGLASEKLPDTEADGLRALMSLDRNGDGSLALAEVEALLAGARLAQ